MEDCREFGVAVSVMTVAEVTYEAIRLSLESTNIKCELPPWGKAPNEIRSTYAGVVEGMLRVDDYIEPRAVFDEWRRDMQRDGWRYGETYDPERKTDPRIVSWDELPLCERLIQTLVASISWAVARSLRSSVMAVRNPPSKVGEKLH